VAYLRTLGIDEALVRTDAVDSTHYLADALGSSVALTSPGGTTATTYTYAPFGETAVAGTPSPNAVRFTGREDDGTGLYYYRARYYDPVRSRFVSEDPMGLVGGDTNFYVYVRNAPTVYIDLLGLDLAVIESGPTQGNPIGHTAIAITGHGVFSRGNDVAPGSSLAAYLAREAPKRNTTVTVIRTTLADDAAALASLRASFPRPLGKIWDNCASTSNEALDAARIANRPWGWSPVPYPGSLPGTAGWRASEAGGTPISIPKGSTAIPNGLSPFEPRVAR
jgi:RHS repeat-associated protein